MNVSLNNPLNLRTVDTVGLLAGSWLLYKIVQTARARARTTKLPGPPAKSWLFGVSKGIFDGDTGELFEIWAKQYGDVFQIPAALGRWRTILIDPKAVSHYFNKSTQTYIKTDFIKQLVADVVRRS